MKIVKKSKLKTKKGKKAYSLLHNNYKVILSERCNCGSRILHNNGGNYHAKLAFYRDYRGKYWYKSYTTCELMEYKWKETHLDKLTKKIVNFINEIGEPNVILTKKEVN